VGYLVSNTRKAHALISFIVVDLTLLLSISKLSVRYLIDSLLTRPSPSVRIVRPLVLNRTVDPYQPSTPTRLINASGHVSRNGVFVGRIDALLK
jgi:hypothetical protein